MSSGPTFKVKFRRRRKSKTNYKKRLALLKSNKLRFVVRRTNNSTICEFVEYLPKGDDVKTFYASAALKKLGWKGHTGNLSAAYLTGYICGKKAIKEGVKEAILDIGLVTPIHGSRVFSALKGAIDAGITIPTDEKVFPSEDRISGKHINEETSTNFEETKKAIEKEFGD